MNYVSDNILMNQCVVSNLGSDFVHLQSSLSSDLVAYGDGGVIAIHVHLLFQQLCICKMYA